MDITDEPISHPRPTLISYTMPLTIDDLSTAFTLLKYEIIFWVWYYASEAKRGVQIQNKADPELHGGSIVCKAFFVLELFLYRRYNGLMQWIVLCILCLIHLEAKV